jgi:iron-sulfur cluster assembly protein
MIHMAAATKEIISITNSAANHIKHLIAKDEAGPIGIKVNIESGGCSGNKYKFEYVYERSKLDEEVVDKDVHVFISPNSVLKLFGTTLDYTDEKVRSGFIFLNPNEKGSCGCGESFSL